MDLVIRQRHTELSNRRNTPETAAVSILSSTKNWFGKWDCNLYADYTTTRHLKFYDAIYKRTYCSDGTRCGFSYDNYEPAYINALWINDMRKALED